MGQGKRKETLTVAAGKNTDPVGYPFLYGDSDEKLRSSIRRVVYEAAKVELLMHYGAGHPGVIQVLARF